MTVYLWDGEPVAYLDGESDDTSIYGFNGKHLGWFEYGIVWDHKGNAVGFMEGALSKITKFEPFKGFKKFKPFKSFTEFEPFKPVLTSRWSSTPLKWLLVLGRKN